MTRALRTRPAVRAAIEGEEDLAAYIDRCASLNGMTVQQLTGHQRHALFWEDPPDEFLEMLSQRTGTPAARLRAATLIDRYPGATPSRSRTGRRYARQPATCRTCSVDTVGARLNLITLCPRCGQLLVDRFDTNPPLPPASTADVQDEVLETLDAAPQSVQARRRLTRLESLMGSAEPAIWSNWPPLLEGESAGSRDRVVDYLTQEHSSPHTTARPPFVTDTVLALTWPATASAASTRRAISEYAVMSDWWTPEPALDPAWTSYRTAATGLSRVIAALELRPEHLPTILKTPDDPLILPTRSRTVRTAAALALAVAVYEVEGRTIAPQRAARDQGHRVSRVVLDASKLMLRSHSSLSRLAVHAQHISDAGRPDLAARRDALRDLRELPELVTSRLPASITGSADMSSLAAGWVWLDATRGRQAGGPHPNASPRTLLDFDERLGPAGRDRLRAWWRDHLGARSAG